MNAAFRLASERRIYAAAKNSVMRPASADGTNPRGLFLLLQLLTLLTLLSARVVTAAPSPAPAASGNALAWPALSREMRPWAYWWWMGSAVDATNITRELVRYRDAGLGGVHIIPI
jgi:hypothetical protein